MSRDFRGQDERDEEERRDALNKDVLTTIAINYTVRSAGADSYFVIEEFTSSFMGSTTTYGPLPKDSIEPLINELKDKVREAFDFEAKLRRQGRSVKQC